MQLDTSAEHKAAFEIVQKASGAINTYNKPAVRSVRKRFTLRKAD